MRSARAPFRAGDTVRFTTPGPTTEDVDARGTVEEDSNPHTGHTRVRWHAHPFSTSWHRHAALTRTDPGLVPTILAAMDCTEQRVRAGRGRP